ncbi:MAG: Iron complex transport system ATP-binding protein [Sporanaerobacter sp.]|jgi:iron complex transport system ATP-binding protein|uniref:ABC transporter ATP-binding protein n=1 Tax=Sporanaerobacter sp. TaxID=2010183 RepID=UPI003A0FC76E
MVKAIKVQSLKFGYKDDLVLKDISFSLEEGQFMSIIGPNGSGKSTLLKNICNLEKPNSGEIEIHGKNISQYKSKELAKKIALVPQDTFISYDFSVFDVVLMGRFPYLGRFDKETDEDFEITKEALKITNTFHLRDRNINEISGGERQRVIIARALAQEPDIIFLDEPTSHLDINHQMDLLNILRNLNKEKNTTIVLVIHDINLACRYSDIIMLLDKGEILSIGSPKEVVTRENIEKAYGLNTIIEENPYTNSLYIVPLSLNGIVKKVDKKEKVHIISGGGTGREIISKLEEAGYDLSLGVINVGDSDWQLGKELSIKMVEEKPFSHISEEAFKKNIQFIREADIVVLGSTPYGRGNMKNLEAASLALNMGKTVYFLDNYSKDNKFDYTDGEAEKLLNEMKGKGLLIINSIDEIIKKA